MEKKLRLGVIWGW